jgi:glucose-induced degradation protein 8
MLLLPAQKQHLVELIREKRLKDALDFAQTHLAEQGRQNAEVLAELEQVMALLAFTEPDTSPFGELLLLSQRHKVWVVHCA